MCKGPELCWRPVAGSSSKRLQHVCVCVRAGGWGAPPRSVCDLPKDSDFHADRIGRLRTDNWPDFCVMKVSPCPPLVRRV